MTEHGSPHGAAAADRDAPPDRRQRHQVLVAGLAGSVAAIIVSAIFITCFIGGLHDPGPRSVPFGVVGPPVAASRVGSALSQQIPGAFTVSSYSSDAAARSAIGDRRIDAALVPGPVAAHLLVASAVSEAETTAITKVFAAAAAKGHVPLVVQNVRPLHSGDPQGLAQLFFVVALTAPSLFFGNQLISRIGRYMNELSHLATIVVYAVSVAAVATAIADAGIGALTGAPWAIFGVGTLVAFAVAVMAAAATRWAGALAYVVLLLLFIPVGISSSGSTLGPHMITQWYADLGRVLPPGAGQTSVRNVTYFNGNAIVHPLLFLSAWALAGTIALALAAVLHPPVPGRSRQRPPAGAAAAVAADVGQQGTRIV